jgi:hypothetical protein
MGHAAVVWCSTNCKDPIALSSTEAEDTLLLQMRGLDLVWPERCWLRNGICHEELNHL